MDRELEVIHDQMEETRASLAEKLEALESQVLETVQSASDTVASAVDGAKEVVASVSEGAKDVVEQVSETVETVKESLNVGRYVEQYPWTSVGAAVAAGFVVARLLPSGHNGSGERYEAVPPPSSGSPYPAPAAATSESARHDQGNGWTGALQGILGPAVSTVEGLAVGTLMSAIKEMVTTSLPREWQGDLTRIVDDVTTQLGGKVMQGNPLHELMSAFQSHPRDEPSSGIQTGPCTAQRPPGQGTPA